MRIFRGGAGEGGVVVGVWMEVQVCVSHVESYFAPFGRGRANLACRPHGQQGRWLLLVVEGRKEGGEEMRADGMVISKRNNKLIAIC